MASKKKKINETSASVHIQSLYPNLRKSEQAVADYILADIPRLLDQSVQAAALQIGVSEASLMRFAKQLGYCGFRELKLRLAEEVGRMAHQQASPIDLTISPDQNLADIPSKIISQTVRSLENTLNIIDLNELERAVLALMRARRIDMYGVSDSASIAQYAMNKFIRLGMRCLVYSDAHQQTMAAITLSRQDVAIGISHSGRTKDTVEALKNARNAGATTICIANFGTSRITKYADIKLLTASFEANFPGDTIVSRISQLAIIDILFTGLFLKGYSKYKGLLAMVESALQDKVY
jgi:DNA-binding MurR/RpiR family transcriptional regulator